MFNQKILRRSRNTSAQYVNLLKVNFENCYRPQRSWGKVIFSEACVKNSVHRGRPQAHTHGGGCVVWVGGSKGPHPGGRLGGLAGGRLQAHTQGVSRSTRGGGGSPGPGLGGGVSQHALRQTPPSRWLLLREVNILLEWIRVHFKFYLSSENR